MNAEKSAWDAVLGSLASTQTKCPSSEDLDPTRPPAATQVDEKVLDQPEQHALLSDLQKQAGSTEDAQSRLGTATKALEFRVDSFADGIHKLDKLRESGDTTTDRILSQAAAMLQQRDEAASSSAGTEKVGIGDLLRSLSRAS